MFPYLCLDTPFTPYSFQKVVLYPLPIPNVDIPYVPITFRWLPLWVPSTCFRTEYSWVEGMAKQRKSWKKRMWRQKSHHYFRIFPFLHSYYYPILIPVCNMIGLLRVSQSCLTLCESMDYTLPGFSIHGILQARTLEWVIIYLSRGSSQPRNETPGLQHCRQIFTIWGTTEC